jgi:hypothetical protein
MTVMQNQMKRDRTSVTLEKEGKKEKGREISYRNLELGKHSYEKNTKTEM